MSEQVNTWFKREVLAHEEALTRYIRRTWSDPDEIHDIRQETYARVYERALTALPLAARPFIFKIARHLMLDRLRRRRVVAIDAVGDSEALDVVADSISPEQSTAAHDELRQLVQAIDRLPPRCREIFWMRRVDELTQKEVAERLGLSEKTVEKQMTKGLKLLTDAMLEPAEAGAGTVAGTHRESGHGKQQTD